MSQRQIADAVPATRIDIGVCTFRRQTLERTLLSVAVIEIPEGVTLRVIVADNDVEPSAEPLVERTRRRLPYDISYVHCPAGNISIARNACLDEATGDYLAFIDDDETASEYWISSLLATVRATGADAVLGPVAARYEEQAPSWMRRGDFHSTRPVWVGGEIRTGYTCNVLLRLRSPVVAGRRFNLALGKSGGEDTAYFTQMNRAGGKIAFAPEALVSEPVPEQRARFGWLAARRYRMGQTHGRLLAEGTSATARPLQIVLAAAKSGYCATAGLLLAPFSVPRNRYLLRAIMHAGVVTGLGGARIIHQYGKVEASIP